MMNLTSLGGRIFKKNHKGNNWRILEKGRLIVMEENTIIDRARTRVEQLEKEKEELQSEIRKLKGKPNAQVGFLILISGLMLISLSLVFSHSVTALIGIALTFWGALLFYIRPARFIKKEILDSALAESLQNIHKLIDELDLRGTPIYISPRTLRGLRTAFLYIPKTDENTIPSDEQLSQEQTLINNPQGIKLTPPGLGLSNLLEKELKTNFSMMPLENVQNKIRKALVEGLEIAEGFEMKINESEIQVDVIGNCFDKVIEEIDEREVNRRIGDPLSSAIASILARSTGQSITIGKIERGLKNKTTRVSFYRKDLHHMN